MSAWDIYLFTRIDSFNVLITLLYLLGICLCISFVCTAFLYGCEWKERDQLIRKRFKKHVPTYLLYTILGGLIVAAIPSQKDVAAMYLIPKIVNSDATKELSKLPVDVSKLLRLKVESWIDDLTPNSNTGGENK